MPGIWNDFINAASAGASAGAQLANSLTRRQELESSTAIQRAKLAQSAQQMADERAMAQEKIDLQREQMAAGQQQKAAELAAEQQNAAARLQATIAQNAMMNAYRQQVQENIAQRARESLAQRKAAADTASAFKLASQGNAMLRTELLRQSQEEQQKRDAANEEIARSRLALAQQKAAAGGEGDILANLEGLPEKQGILSKLWNSLTGTETTPVSGLGPTTQQFLQAMPTGTTPTATTPTFTPAESLEQPSLPTLPEPTTETGTSPMGGGADETPPGRVRVIGPNGELGSVEEGDELPEGWEFLL